MKQIFYVDRAKCGDEEPPAGLRVGAFCGVAQVKLPGVEIMAVTDTIERTVNRGHR